MLTTIFNLKVINSGGSFVEIGLHFRIGRHIFNRLDWNVIFRDSQQSSENADKSVAQNESRHEQSEDGGQAECSRCVCIQFGI